jgi:hypothetical protein
MTPSRKKHSKKLPKRERKVRKEFDPDDDHEIGQPLETEKQGTDAA